MSDPRDEAEQLRNRYLAAGDPVGWFEELYATADDDREIPWADLEPNPLLIEWAQREGATGPGKALTVGCGLGDDAEFLSGLGFDVLAFDVSATAIRRCRERFTGSKVDYVAYDLLNLPPELEARYDLVVEAYTLQVLPPEIHMDAATRMATLVAPGGRLVVICRGRDPWETGPGLHWPLTRLSLTAFQEAGLEELQFEDFMDDETPPVRRFRVTYRRPA